MTQVPHGLDEGKSLADMLADHLLPDYDIIGVLPVRPGLVEVGCKVSRPGEEGQVHRFEIKVKYLSPIHDNYRRNR